MKKFLIIVITAMVLCGCTDSDRTIRTAEDMGFTDIQPTGYSFFSCSEDDQFSTAFTAKNSQGKSVSGVVCSGWFKGATLRLF